MGAPEDFLSSPINVGGNTLSKRISSLGAAAAALAVTGALALAGGASGAGAASALPTLNIALTGTHGVSVSGSTVSGAVNVVSTFTGKGQGEAGIVRLNPGVTLQQAIAAVNSHGGDPNALTPYGAIVFDAGAPSSTQTVLTPGNYAALNLTSQNGPGGFATFTVTQSATPAALPAAKTTQTAIEFGFKGPSVLRDGTIVRAQDGGYLVHMIIGFGVKNRAVGRQVMALLRAGKDGKAQKLSNHSFLNLAGPLSPGGMQQAVLNAKPGYYVEACFMDTQDHREHTRLGMLRLVRVVK
jgi:hypothetical protein